MSLVQSACLNGQDPYDYLRYVMACLTMQQCASQIGELLPHRWKRI